ncbi:MAG TPA: HAD family hydrolase [Candidatus Dormibacteraeota bacterium]|nr:HAD family hydrolase [Candidatus Dormibacteraeota bacterium]
MSTPDLSARPALLFDLDGTLVDSVYQHVLSWREALEGEGIDLSVWRIHRRIGMSGGLFLKALERELGHDLGAGVAERLAAAHAAGVLARMGQIRPLPGARELLSTLTSMGVRWAIATSGAEKTARPTLAMLSIPSDVPVITRDQVAYAKPNPDLFLAASERLGVGPGDCFVVGDSIWDMLAARRAGSLGIGLLSGGYGKEELQEAGPYRVYYDPADLLEHLDELGIRAGR